MPGAPQLDIFTLAQRPELRPRIFSAEFAAAVPEFMRHDPTAELYYASPHFDRYLGFALAALNRDEPDRVVARALSVPFAFATARRDGRNCPIADGTKSSAERTRTPSRDASRTLSARSKSWWWGHIAGAAFRG